MRFSTACWIAIWLLARAGAAAWGAVSDELRLLPAADVESLNRELSEISKNTGVEVSVVLPGSTSADSAADRWRAGLAAHTNGILFVLAPQERKLVIEASPALDESLPEDFRSRVGRNEVWPFLRQGRYADGIRSGLLALQARIPLGLDPSRHPDISAGSTASDRIFIFLAWLCTLVILALVARHPIRALEAAAEEGTLRSLDRGSGGSWGGGGGGFSGGGASSDW